MRQPEFYLNRPITGLQTMLRLISNHDPRIFPVVPDGLYGPNTYASVRSFQEANGLSVTGQADQTTWDAIASAYAAYLPEERPPAIEPFWFPGQSIRPGERNIHLYLVQAMLLALSAEYPALAPPAVDGILNPETEQDLRWIQEKSGLPVTGILNTLTWHALTALYRASAGTGAS